MRGKRQNIQYSLALELSERGETLVGGYQGVDRRTGSVPIGAVMH